MTCRIGVQGTGAGNRYLARLGLALALAGLTACNAIPAPAEGVQNVTPAEALDLIQTSAANGSAALAVRVSSS